MGVSWPAAISITCIRCSAASGHSDATWLVLFFSAACAAGLPTFTATSKFSVRAPQMPPWPLHRSITATRVLGMRRSISAPFGAHVLRPRVAGEMQADAAFDRGEALGQAVLLGDVDDVLGEIEGRLRQPLDRRDPWAGSAAIRTSASARRTASAPRCRSPCRPTAAARRKPCGPRRRPVSRSPSSSLGMPQQAGCTTSVSTPFLASTPSVAAPMSVLWKFTKQVA